MFETDPKTATIGKEVLPFDMGFLPDFYQKKAEVQLGETPTRKAQCLRQLRELAKNEKHLCKIEFDDDFLVQFLRMKKYDSAKAFSVLKKFITLRRKYPDIFSNFRFEITIQTVTDRIVYPLPYRCQDGCMIIVVELDNWDPEVFPVEEVRKMLALILLQCIRDPMTQVNGFKAIIDVKSNPLKHIRHITPQNMYLIYHGIQHCLPGRYKSVHIVNLSATFRAAWLLIKPFLTDKLKKRIRLHSSLDELMEFFPPCVLPVQYGGELKDFDMSGWLKKVMEPEQLVKFGGGPIFK